MGGILDQFDSETQGKWMNSFVSETKIRKYCTSVQTPIDEMFAEFDSLLLVPEMKEKLTHLRLKGKIFVCSKVWSCVFSPKQIT